jgi:LPS-assembly protein
MPQGNCIKENASLRKPNLTVADKEPFPLTQQMRQRKLERDSLFVRNQNRQERIKVNCTTLVPAFALACCVAQTAAAAESFQAQQWEISADKLTRLENPARIVAEGHVELVKTEKRAKKSGGENKGWGDLLGEEKAAQAEPASGAAAPHAEPDTVATSKTVPVIQDNAAEDSAAAPGGVTVTKVMTTVKADWMSYEMDHGMVTMRGHVFIDIGPDRLTAEAGEVNLNQETGVFENALILREYKDIHFEGRKIEKTGELTYHIEDGWIITCKLKDGETPPWSFKASEADITDGGYAYLKHATFRIKDVPVLYTPIMLLPAKRSRQTGFLFPLVSLSDRSGFGLELPLFIDLSPSSDITLYPHYISERGFMAGAEMRYMLDQKAQGAIMGNFLSDRLSDKDEADSVEYYADTDYTHTNKERYWFRGKADQQIGEWTARADLDVVSDRDYLAEFDSGRTGISVNDEYFVEQFGRGLQDRTVDQRSNKLNILRSWENGTSFRASFNGVNDVAEETEGADDPLWKLPEFKYSGLVPLYDTGMNLSWDADYVNYWRDKGAAAQRIDLYPKLSRKVPLMEQYLDTTVGIGVRDTMYAIDGNGKEEWEDSDTENRLLGVFETEVATTLKKDMDAWSHAVMPFVKYNFVTDGDQEKMPQFDDVDSFGDQNSITYGLKNFFYVLGQKGGEREYGYIKIEQDYDLRSEADEAPFQPVEVRTAWYPSPSAAFKYETDLSVYDDGFLTHNVEGDYLSGRGDLFSLDYLFNKNTGGGDDTSSLKLAAKVGLLYNFSAGYSLEQSLENSVKVQEKVSLTYNPACWAVELAAETTPGNEQVTLMFQLANIGAPFGLDVVGR